MVRLNAVVSGFLVCQAATIEKHQMEANLNALISEKAGSSLEMYSSLLLNPEVGDSTNIHEALKAVSSQIDLQSAASLMQKKPLPDDVSNLVAKVKTGSYGDMDEASLAKGRRALNDLVEKAWIELDDKIMDCKGFEDMNRANYGQVRLDLARLAEQINDMSRVESESISGISEKEQEIADVEELLRKEHREYTMTYTTNKDKLTIHKNDLDVFQFILTFTRCEGSTSLAQLKVCEYRDGSHEGHKTFMFADKTTAAKYDKILTPNARKMVDNLLRSVEHATATSFLQEPSNYSTTPQPTASERVMGQDWTEFKTMKCGPTPPDCGLLHDKMSLMWGEYKDKVDELTMVMMKNQFEYEELKENLNGQIRMLAKSKARFSQMLSEARSNLAADRAEIKTKKQQEREIDQQYFKYMMACKKRITWILGQDMCAIVTVRNAVLENSTTCPSAGIVDCDMDDWVEEACTVSCDDNCDSDTPFKCGGWMQLNRQPIVVNDDCGVQCPAYSRYKRCGQYHCPIDCHMSEWSGWSKCTADCEGGVQSHTRNIMMKPKNGGEQCNTVEEARACNTESCDRDCRLAQWTKFSPCSMACGGGLQERRKHVSLPTRGEGKCPRSDSYMRYKQRSCNTQPCNGDEICIAQQDLVIAVDGSGSVTASGFTVETEWVDVLLDRYATKYFGQKAMKIGIVLFGNGIIMPDGRTVSPAINAQRLSFKLNKVKAAVKGLPFKKGFTNMAQAFAMAEDMFVKGSRSKASQSIMVVTDGQPSFSYMTNEMVEQLDDKGIMRYFVLISEKNLESKDSSLRYMKIWANTPPSEVCTNCMTNIVHVEGGLAMLEADADLWAEQAVTKFCPQAYSPKAAEYRNQIYGYQHVKDSGYCAKMSKKNLLSKTAENAQACAALAGGAGANSFIFGTWIRRGYCYKSNVDVPDFAELYHSWETPEGRQDPSCPTGWRSSMLFDFYAVEPVATTPV